jgi:septal ring factor EnvC (AmiA/AmiB activator)
LPAEGSLNPAVEEALRQVLARKAALDLLDAEAEKLSDERERISNSQERLRENMKALKGSPEEKALVQRYTKQLDEQETRLAELEKQEAELDARITAARRELNDEIGKLRFDVTL